MGCAFHFVSDGSFLITSYRFLSAEEGGSSLLEGGSGATAFGRGGEVTGGVGMPLGTELGGRPRAGFTELGGIATPPPMLGAALLGNAPLESCANKVAVATKPSFPSSSSTRVNDTSDFTTRIIVPAGRSNSAVEPSVGREAKKAVEFAPVVT